MNKFAYKSHAVYFVVIIQIVMLLFLFWNGYHSFQQFKQYHNHLSQHSSQSVATGIEILLANLRRGLKILVTENPDLIASLAEDPGNEAIINTINAKLNGYFPYFHAVTVTDDSGEPFLDDFGEKIGDFCLRDISLFAEDSPQYGISIHPGPAEYHFDVMVKWRIDEQRYEFNSGVFFVSFAVDSLVNILNDGQLPGHKIYLLHKELKNLIEMTAKGSRNVLGGENFIDEAIEDRIIYREPIEGTLWQVVDLVSEQMIKDYRQHLLLDNLIIFISLMLFMVIMLAMILREERKRKAAELEVLSINENLEQLVSEKTSALEKFYSAIEQAADATVIADSQGKIEYVNNAFVELSGYDHKELLGKTSSVLKSGRHNEEFYHDMWQKLQAGESFHAVFVNRRKDGSLFHEEKTITSIKDKNGQISHYVGTGKDVSERLKHQEELSYLAHHDILTGLPNRVLLQDRIEHSLVMAHRHSSKLALMYLNMDRFKSVNDRLGHKYGDELLIRIAKRLSLLLQDGDTLCRSGGDEFIVLLENIEQEERVGMVAQRIVQSMSEPFQLKEHVVNIGVSVGIAIYPDNGSGHDELIKNADMAMHLAKEKNTTGYEFFSNIMSAQMIEKVEMEARLFHALAQNEFDLVYQPKVDIQTGETVGFEALLRWHNADFGFVSPDKFIPILESSGLIHEVGDWILQEVIKQVTQDRFQGCMISVNLSPIQFRHDNFINMVQKHLQQNEVLSSKIEFEITESLLMEEFEQSKIKLQALCDLGCSIALDDFGTGYSSLSYLTQLPIDVLKVDRSFITNIHQYPQQQVMLESIIFMTKKLQISVVIEGVESMAELRKIIQLGGHIIQGYYFSKPLKDIELDNWLTNPVLFNI